MIEIKTSTTRIWAKWCRRNCGTRWRMELGSEKDSYYFERQEDANKFQQRLQQYDEQLQEVKQWVKGVNL